MSWRKYAAFFWMAQEMPVKIHSNLVILEFMVIRKKDTHNKIWLAAKLSEKHKSLGYTWWTDKWTILICSLVFFLSTYLIWQSNLSVKQKQLSGMASMVFFTGAELNFWSNSVLWYSMRWNLTWSTVQMILITHHWRRYLLKRQIPEAPSSSAEKYYNKVEIPCQHSARKREST